MLLIVYRLYSYRQTLLLSDYIEFLYRAIRFPLSN